MNTPFKGINMSETIQIGVLGPDAAPADAANAVHIMTSPDGNTLTISMAEFVANPTPYATALASITRRPIQLQFV
jgi:hypothetical protein